MPINDTIDYYPFGMQMPGKVMAFGAYSYGFNSQEKTDEIAGSGNSYTAEFWQYDSRLGRRWNVDPKADFRSWISPYSCYQNNPVFHVDPTGELDGEYTIDKETGKTTKISDLGDEDGVDFYHVGESRDDGSAFVVDETITFERNKDDGISAENGFSSASSRSSASNLASVTIEFIAADIAIPDPTDAVLPKWIGYAIAGSVAGTVLYFSDNPFPKPWYTDRPNNYIPPKPNFPSGPDGGDNFLKWLIGGGFAGGTAYSKYRYDQKIHHVIAPTPNDKTLVQPPIIKPYNGF